MSTAPKGDIGVAVSGGGDSVALLVLLAEWAKANGRHVAAATVDHGLRPGSAKEASDVARLCTRLQIEHTVLLWTGPKDQGNLQDAARRARQRLLANWAAESGLCAIATGHTRDDQAETFLQRLKRGSGVDGLSAMQPKIRKNNQLWIRPLLTVRREALRVFLRAKGVSWVEDPSNEDPRFDRIKFRNAQKKLDEIGLTVDCLADTAMRMASARKALEHNTLDLAKRCARPKEIGSVHIDLTIFASATSETQLRLFAHCLRWVSNGAYRPRFRALKTASLASRAGQKHTLSGCILAPLANDVIEITREPSAMGRTDPQAKLFDQRWAVTPDPGIWRALGTDGISKRPNWRNTAESRNALLASPSLWYNNELKSAPFVDKDNAYRSSLVGGIDSFFTSILTH